MAGNAPITESAQVERVLQHIVDELRRAIEKHPTWPNSPIVAAAIVAEESGELVRAALNAVYEPTVANRQAAQEEAIQTAATCVRFALSMGMYHWTQYETHKHLGEV